MEKYNTFIIQFFANIQKPHYINENKNINKAYFPELSILFLGFGQ